MEQHHEPMIVCGLDDSDHAATVLDAAAVLAERLALPLWVVHSPGADLYTVGERRLDVVEQGRRAMARLTDGHDVAELIVQPGSPAEVLRAVMARGAALGVVGSRGRAPLRAAVMGSVSAELACSAPCPVVIVAPGAMVPDQHEESSVVCRLSGSVDEVGTLRAAAWISDRLGAARLAVNVADGPLGHERFGPPAIERRLDGLALDVAIRVETDDPIDQIHQVADANGATLIVVGSGGRSPLRSSLSGAVAGRLITEARRPVMVVSPEASHPGHVRVPVTDVAA
jgi:nucleotide-binding universal stress UspA family protein